MFDIKRTVLSTRFKGVFIASMATMTASYILVLTDNVVAGQFLGAEAVAAMTLILPLNNFLSFISFLITDGLAIIYSYALGQQDRAEADRIFSQGIILSGIASVLFLLILILGRDAILSIWDISPALMELAREYYSALMWLPPFMFFETYLYTILITEGEERLCTISSVGMLLSNIVLDFVLCDLMGVYGLGLATVSGRAILIPILCTFFARKDCRIHFRWHFDLRQTMRGIFYSVYQSIGMLCLSILPLITSAYMLENFGENHIITVTTIVNVMTLIISLYFGLIDCLQPMVCQYHAEGSLWSIKKTMRLALFSSNGISLMVMALGMIFAPILPQAFGVEDEKIIEESALALRIVLPSTIFLDATVLYAIYYICIEKLNTGAAFEILVLLIMPTAGMWVGSSFDLTGFWIGFSASFVAAFIFNWLWSKGNFLLIDELKLNRQLSYDINATFDEVMELTRRADGDLKRLELTEAERNRLVLWIEELGLAAADRSNGEEFQLEISILTDREPKVMIVRDNGAPLSDEVKNNLSFRERFIELMSKTLNSRKYFTSGDENRLVIKI